MWGKRNTFFRHTIGTAEIASFCDANSKIIMLTGKLVCEKGRERFRGFERIGAGQTLVILIDRESVMVS